MGDNPFCSNTSFLWQCYCINSNKVGIYGRETVCIPENIHTHVTRQISWQHSFQSKECFLSITSSPNIISIHVPDQNLQLLYLNFLHGKGFGGKVCNLSYKAAENKIHGLHFLSIIYANCSLSFLHSSHSAWSLPISQEFLSRFSSLKAAGTCSCTSLYLLVDSTIPRQASPNANLSASCQSSQAYRDWHLPPKFVQVSHFQQAYHKWSTNMSLDLGEILIQLQVHWEC